MPVNLAAEIATSKTEVKYLKWIIPAACSLPFLFSGFAFALSPDQMKHEDDLTRIATSRCDTEFIKGKDYRFKILGNGNIQINLLGKKGGELEGTFEYTREQWEGRQQVLEKHQANENRDRRKCIGEEVKSLKEQYIPPSTTSTINNKYGFGRIGIGTPISDVVSKMNGQILHDFEKSADQKKFQIVDWTDSIFNEEYNVRGYAQLDNDVIQQIRLTNKIFSLREGYPVEKTGYSASKIDEVCSEDGAESFATKTASANDLNILSVKYSETHNGVKDTENYTPAKSTIENWPSGKTNVHRAERQWTIVFSDNNISSKIEKYFETSAPHGDVADSFKQYFSCTKYVFLGDWS